MEIAATISPLTPKLTGIKIARVNGAFGDKEQIIALFKPYQGQGLVTFLDLPRNRKKWRSNEYTDQELFELAKEIGLSYVAVSYVESAEDLVYNFPTIAKIESNKGVENMKEIAKVADMILVDRRDLATSIGIANIPMAVKHIISVAREYKRPVILASEFLINMVNGGEPALAEVQNVSEAMANGADYLLLAEETALGRHPQKTIDLVREISDSQKQGITDIPYSNVF